MSTATLYSPSGYYKSERIKIIAKYSGKDIALKEEKFTKLPVPEGSVPVLVDGDLVLFETNAIANYVANCQLKGAEKSYEVAQWCNFSDFIILPAIGTLVYPCMGLMQYNKSESEKAKKVVDNELRFINEVLKNRTFLVGERITIADITLFSDLRLLFELVYDEELRRPLVNVLRWYKTIANQENVKSVVGDLKLCEVPAKFDPKKYAELHPASKQDKKEKVEKKPKEQKVQKKEDEKKKEPKPKDDDDEDEDEKPRPEKKCPYAALPKGSFDLDEWKRTYCNNDFDTVALPYFWNKFDKDHYSIWFCEYLYPEELELLFMTSNLINGMYQRLDKLQKHAFASMAVIGENNKNTIKGLWIWKGQDLAFTLHEDCMIDFESYKWEKLDPNSESTKDLLVKYFSQKGDLGAAASFKIFK